MLTVYIERATAKHKKWKAFFSDGSPSVNFGDNRFEDFTQHKDPQRMANYISRHRADPTSPKTPGELSRVLLWSHPDWR